MSDEANAGAAYLAALKKSTPQAAAAATARAPILPSPSLNKGIGAPANTISPVDEKRKSPRYRCQGSARLREIVSWCIDLGNLHGHQFARMLCGSHGNVPGGRKARVDHGSKRFSGRMQRRSKSGVSQPWHGDFFHHDVRFGSRAFARIVAVLISPFGNFGCSPRGNPFADP